MEIRIRYATAPAITADDATTWEWQAIALPWEPATEEDYRNWETVSRWDEQLAVIAIRELPLTMLVVDATAELHNPEPSYREWFAASVARELAFWDAMGC
jgi:hypothetical protein